MSFTFEVACLEYSPLPSYVQSPEHYLKIIHTPLTTQRALKHRDLKKNEGHGNCLYLNLMKINLLFKVFGGFKLKFIEEYLRCAFLFNTVQMSKKKFTNTLKAKV